MSVSDEFIRQITSGEVVPVLPPFYENSVEGGFEPMPDEMLLVQPCVVAAIEKARNEAFDNRFEGGGVEKRVMEIRDANSELEHLHVRCVRHVLFEGSLEAVAQQIARSLPVGIYGHRARVIVEDGGIMPWPAT